LSAAAVPAVSIGLILATDTRWLGSDQAAAAARARLVGQLLLTEAVLAVVWAPLMGLFAAMRVSASGGQLAGRSPAAKLVIGAWQLGRLLVTRIALMTALSGGIVLAMRTTLDASTLVSAHAILGAAALAFATLGAACARMFREPLDAAACATGLALLTAFALFAGGPVLDSIPPWFLTAALAVNPIVATATSANIDLFRMDLLYQLSPLAHRHVEYPALITTFGVHVLAAVALLGLSARPVTNR
jgi:hypothetical protein